MGSEQALYPSLVWRGVYVSVDGVCVSVMMNVQDWNWTNHSICVPYDDDFHDWMKNDCCDVEEFSAEQDCIQQVCL